MKIAHIFVGLTLSALSLGAIASDIMVVKPQAFSTREGQPNAAAFIEIHNHGKDADRLEAVKFSAAVAARGELHSMTLKDGRMTMRALPGVDLPPGGTIKMQPGGDHLMLIGLKRALKAGETLEATLIFQKAGEVKVSIPVVDRAPAAKQEGHGGHGGMKH
jgi:copper(I)-binding protein